MSLRLSILGLAALAAACGAKDASSPPPAAADVDAGAPADGDASATPGAPFSLVIVHAKLFSDAQGDAVGVRGRAIAEIGASDALAARCTDGCALVDARGAFVQPGFHDAHVHLYSAGQEASLLRVYGANVTAIQTAVKAWAASHPSDPWILGRGWISTQPPLPTHADLDATGITRPIALTDHTGHNLWVNAAALAAANITAATPDPAGGRIVRDASGAPTGILLDAAATLVTAKVPPYDDASIEKFILAGEAMSIAAGVTTSQGGPVSLDIARAYARLDAENRLRQRTFLWAPIGVSDDVFAQWVDFAHGLPKDGKVQVVAFKGFVDGTLATETASMLDPYADDPASRGPIYRGVADLAPLVVRANRAGFPAAVHAIGDRAVRTALDAFEAARATTGTTLVNRVEHASVVDPADMPRFAALGVAASVQPVWMTEGPPAAAAPKLGAARLAHFYPWRSLAAAGATLVFGSDMPSSDQDDPVAGIWGAVARTSSAGPFLPEEGVDATLALRAFTSVPAEVVGWGDRLGKIAPGYTADLVMLARDPRGARSIADDPIQRMWIAGQEIHP